MLMFIPLGSSRRRSVHVCLSLFASIFYLTYFLNFPTDYRFINIVLMKYLISDIIILSSL